jgi:hypothetical protein
MDHLGVEVATTDEVRTATDRLAGLGLFTQVENDTTCCYARQDKVWVHGPGAEPWEVYTVTGDSAEFGTAPATATTDASTGDRAGAVASSRSGIASTQAGCCGN